MKHPAPLIVILAFLCGAVCSLAQAFNPGDYGTVSLHLKADTLGLVNGAPVASWGPLTAASTAQPAFIASDARFNNKPAVKFDGVNDLMTWSSANLNARTIFAVTTIESGGINLAGLLSNGSDGLNIRRAGTTLFYRSPGQGMDGNDFVGNGTPTGTLSINNVASGSFTVGVPHLVIATAGAQKTYANFWLGAPATSGGAAGRWWNGAVAEVLIYDGVLSQTGIDAVGYYLQTKYNLPTAFPAPTPTVSSFTAATGGITASTGVLSTPGASVTLAWDVANASTVSIDHGALASSASATGFVTVSPTSTTTYTLTATNTAGSVTKSVTVYIGLSMQSLVLNEFLADNGSGIRDEDGTRQDWIEIYNPNPFAVSANGWQLVDGSNAWTIPNLIIEGSGYAVIFASGKNRTNPSAPLHTNFSLSKNGEYLALKRPDTTIATEFTPAYPAQHVDLSYGLYAGSPAYFPTPTPGAPNGPTTVAGFVEDTAFSIHRGFFTTPQSVAITCPTPGATIKYTVNNSTPTETNGTVYSGPLTITSTTVLRARAFKGGFLPSNTDTQTYVFPADVPNQIYGGGAPAGWPTPGSAQLNGQTMRYGFNATLKAQYTSQQILDALNQVPSLSIVTDQANLTDQTNGIYVNALSKGDAWERASSVEYLLPDNSAGFHINCGLRIRGGASRNDYAPKHSFRLFFRNQYGGDGKLEFPLHGTDGTDEFETIDIRSEENYSWANDTGTENTAVREVFSRDLSGVMGQPKTRSRYLHVYLNGQYWGLYMTEERAQEDYGASYYGGAAEDYDVVQTSNHDAFTYELASGSIDAWQQTWNLARTCAASPTNANYFALLGRDANGVRVPSMPVYIDPEHLASYMLLHYYTGDGDGPLSNFLSMNRANNWRGMRNRFTDMGWRFFPHDCEHTLLAPSWVSARATNNTTTGSNRSIFTYSNSEWIHEDLATNAEYRLKIADVAQRNLFNNGPLTPAAAQTLFDARASQIDKAIIADCVRWGTNTTNHTYAQWQARLANIRSSFFPSRAAAVLSQLQSRGFYPTATPPVFSQRGGSVAAGYLLTLSAGAQTGSIYYTLDGSDPRAVGGAPRGTAYTGAIPITATLTNVQARFRSSGGIWSALDAAFFTVDTVPANASNLVVSRLDYNPIGGNANEFIELMNISAQNVDLTGVHLRGAVEYDFADHTILPPGGRMQVVGDLTAFATRFSGVPGLMPVGPFSGNFSNDGEQILLTSDSQGTLKDFAYSNALPWPTEADGGGYHLVLVRPTTNPDHNLAANWRGSQSPDTAPGAPDSVSFAGNPLDDLDGDGLKALVEYTLGTSDTSGTAGPGNLQQLVQTFTVNGIPDAYLTLTLTRQPTADGAVAAVQFSPDLATWFTDSAHVVLVNRIRDGAGNVVETWRAAEPINPGAKQFLRVRVQLQ